MYKLVFIAALCASGALGQTVGSASPPNMLYFQSGKAEFGPIGITAAMAGPAATIAGAPYTAEAVTRSEQVLADGNRIIHSATNSVARDSQGRVRREESLPGLANSNGDMPHLVMIDDPIAGLHWILDPQAKTASKMPIGKANVVSRTGGPGDVIAPPAGDATFFTTNGPPGGPIQIQMIKTAPNGAPDGANLTKTDLGTQNIEGVPAKGTKTTRVFAAGRFGNEQPLTITTETWFSPDLKVLVMSKTNDPRMGETTYELKNLSRGEPDPTLFQVPADYAIKDQPNVFVYQSTKQKQ